MMADELESRLVGVPIQVRSYTSIGSTNDAALDWAMHGSPDYGLVFADHQSSGRGRLDRNWITPPGVALAFSLVIHPKIAESKFANLFSPLAALALCEALQKFPVMRKPKACEVKWPNDVLVHGRKTAGILVESTWLGNKMHSAVIGMGINIKPESVPAPKGLLFPATCLETETGCVIDRFDLLRDILEKLIHLRSIMLEKEFIDRYQHLLAFKNQKVNILDEKGIIASGIVSGIAPNGDLLLEDESGKTISAISGDVHLRPS
jgi:BirA family biotin operon repressor/biotin-[acetyl-CoA-carboxylase] ligase